MHHNYKQIKTTEMNANVFNKENQENLRTIYSECILDEWGNQDSMFDYIIKKSELIVPICNGEHIIIIEKPKIEKNFWLGYSDCGQGMTWEDASDARKNINNNKEKYFIQNNLQNVNSSIDELKKALEGNMKVYYSIHYTRKSHMSKVCNYDVLNLCNTPINDAEQMNNEDIKLLIDGFEIVKTKFEKRLLTYLKKFGTKKITTQTYWCDR